MGRAGREKAGQPPQTKRRRQEPSSWLSALFSCKENAPPATGAWQAPMVWEAADRRDAVRRRSPVFVRDDEPFVLEATAPRGGGEDRLGLYLRYVGTADRVCVRFRLSLASGTAGGPQQAWRSPGVITFGKAAQKGFVFTNWGNSSFVLPDDDEFPVSVRCDLAIVNRPLHNPLLKATAPGDVGHARSPPRIGSEADPLDGKEDVALQPQVTPLCVV